MTPMIPGFIFWPVSDSSLVERLALLGGVDTYRIHSEGDDCAVFSGGLFEAGCHASKLLELA